MCVCVCVCVLLCVCVCVYKGMNGFVRVLIFQNAATNRVNNSYLQKKFNFHEFCEQKKILL